MFLRYTACILLLVISSAALAGGEATQVPEGSQVTLFALGLLGVIIGRRMAVGRPKQD